MNVFELITIATGLSLDVCAVIICCGSLLLRISKKKLILSGLVVALWQVVALVAGHLITFIPGLSHSIQVMSLTWKSFAAVIFLVLGVYMFAKAWKQKPVEERREEGIRVKHVFAFSFAVSLDAFFAGIAFGFIESTSIADASNSISNVKKEIITKVTNSL